MAGRIVSVWCAVAVACAAGGAAEAKVRLHPRAVANATVTPDAAVTAARKGTDVYTQVGGALGMDLSEQWATELSYTLGIDHLSTINETYSNPGLRLDYFVTPKVAARLKTSANVSHSAGYHAQLVGLGLAWLPTDAFTLEAIPRVFFDSVGTQQYELGAAADIGVLPQADLRLTGMLGRGYVASGTSGASYALGAGGAWHIGGLFALTAFVDYSHGLSTASPSHIVNTTAKINPRAAGSREAGTVPTDPQQRAITVTIGLTAQYR